jgi:hypothetical protein
MPESTRHRHMMAVSYLPFFIAAPELNSHGISEVQGQIYGITLNPR